MTRTQLETATRRAMADLTPDQQELALVRAMGCRVVVWHNLSVGSLETIHGSIRAVALIWGGQ